MLRDEVDLTVNKIPKNEKYLDIEGPEGTIFTRPLIIVIDGARERELQGLIDEYWGKLAEIENDRAFVLVGALLMENAINMLLAAIIPNFRSYNEKTDATFSTKIELARDLKIVPIRHLNVADRIRDIRNDFAHELEMDSFDKISENKAQSLRTFLDTYTEGESKGKNVKEVFQLLVTKSTLALWIFSKHVSLLNDFIRSDSLKKPLQNFRAGA